VTTWRKRNRSNSELSTCHCWDLELHVSCEQLTQPHSSRRQRLLIWACHSLLKRLRKDKEAPPMEKQKVVKSPLLATTIFLNGGQPGGRLHWQEFQSGGHQA
ncbi:hypothetical protein J0S82_003534, partial [Galemys pyrenaicus]